MKKSVLIGLLSLATVGITAKDYVIEGKCLDPNATGQIALVAYNDNHQLDTIAKGIISNGQFLIKGSLSSPAGEGTDVPGRQKVGYLLINDRLKDYIPIILDDGKYEMVLDGNVVLSLTGTKEQDVLSKYIETRIEQAQLLE